jgi:dihydrofolate synthase/folylpolyglutamate synthase
VILVTYEQALEYLASLNKFGMNFGLERIEKLLELMGHPERRFRTIHIAGTNGKGSTAAMLSAILCSSGIKTAMYTSPHLTEYTERMTVNGEQITRQAFAGALEHTSRFVAEMTAEGWEHPTEFEVLTAAAFYYFAAAGTEYAVIEAGLGGLLDSTNVIVPEVSVITNISLDHTDRCGVTVAEIAGHKAGIIKQGVPVVTAAKGAALDVIRANAHDKAAPLYVLGRDFYGAATGRDGYRQKVTVATRSQGDLGTFILNLVGRHQAENCAVAVRAALLISDQEPRISIPIIGAGLATVCWPGRFEIFDSHPTVVIDGAHNPDGARVLRTALDEVFPGKDITFLLGILADKDIAGITGALVRSNDSAVVVRPLSDRAAQSQTVAAQLSASWVDLAASIEEGLLKARARAGSSGVVCIAGSLYLIGPARDVVSRQNKSVGI